jgi:hypothetical protein
VKVLIITSCTGEKKLKPGNQLTFADFKKIGTSNFSQREKELKDYQLPAGEMYTGQQHIRLMRGLKLMAEASKGEIFIDLRILSAGYGLLDDIAPIVPYEVTFNGMKAKELRNWADFLKIPEKVFSAIEDYDLSIFLLGKEYLKAIKFPKTLDTKSTLVFLTGKGSETLLPSGPNIKTIFLGNADARRMGAGLVALKGRAMEILGEKAAETPVFFKKIIKSPDLLIAFWGEYKKATASNSESKAKRSPASKKRSNNNPDALLKADFEARTIKLTEEWLKRPHRKKIRYFIPEWDDLVNPQYDFINDIHPDGTGDGYEFANYAHQLYESPPYDGILISKIVVEMKKNKKAIFEKLGVHRYLRVPRDFPIMGDCGAFGYIMEDEPPYQTDEILDYYQRLDFDYGVSIDHLIVNAALQRGICYLIDGKGNQKEIPAETFEELKKTGKAKEIKSLKRQLELFDGGPNICRQEVLDEKKRNRRYEITINNALDFIEGHRKGGYRFVPIGAAQGWSPESYADAVAEYQKMGYQYIALGGLVRTTSAGIIEVLEAVQKVLKKGIQLHLFGVARPDAIEEMHRLGVTSVDSASFLRRAWLGASANYHMPNEKYAAVRIPQAEKSPRAKKMVWEGKISLEGVRKLEEKCLRLLRSYDRKECDLDEVLEVVMAYDDLMGGNRNGHEKLIQNTLEDRPWEKCQCKICKECGVEVIIFRGNNRNRRRGFHNTKIFYDQFCRLFGDR